MSRKINNPTLLLGAHTSIAGGIEKSIERGEELNLTAIQIFTKSNRQWNAKNITPETASLFKQALKKSSILDVVVHASYLINLGTTNQAVAQKSLNALIVELERCEVLGLTYLVLHPGSHQSMPERESLLQIADFINQALATVEGKSMVILENMAGQGSNLCYRFEQLAFIIKHITNKKRIGICFDTCHAFAAGYDFTTPSTYKNLWEDFDSAIGRSYLKVLHLNDSKKGLGSRMDRHAFIGKGLIGLDAFELLINDQSFFSIPKILETPIETPQDYIPDLIQLVNLVKPTNQNLLKNNPLSRYLEK